MKKICCLFTSEYPFASGEPFLESEVCFLRNAFDEIHIFPFFVNKNAIQTRLTPNNFYIHPLYINKKKRVYFLIKGLFGKKKQFDHHLTFKEFLYECFLSGRIHSAFKRSKKFISEIDKESVIYVYSYWSNYIGTLALFFKKELLRQKFVVVKNISRAHGCDIYYERKGISLIPFQAFNVLNTNYIYPCSKDGESILKVNFPNFSDKISCRYLGVEPNYLNTGDLNSNVFLTVSYFIPVKRMEFFCNAFISFHKEHPNWKWIAVGGGDDVIFSKVRKMLKENNVSDSVHLMGPISNSELIQLYRTNHFAFFVNTSSSEGLPVSIMEAQSFGIPCIAPNVGGISEIVNKENGFLFEQTNSKSDLVSVLEKACQLSNEEYKNLSKKSFENTNTIFNSSLNYEKFVKEFAE